MVTSLKKWSIVLLALFMLAGVRSVVQAQRGPIDSIAQCVDGAAQEFADCTSDAPWWYAGLCALRYAANAALCGPATILP